MNPADGWRIRVFYEVGYNRGLDESFDHSPWTRPSSLGGMTTDEEWEARDQGFRDGMADRKMKEKFG